MGLAVSVGEEDVTLSVSRTPGEDKANAKFQNSVSRLTLHALQKNPWTGCQDCGGSPEDFQIYSGAVEAAQDRLKAANTCGHSLERGTVEWRSFYILPDLTAVTNVSSETVGNPELVALYRRTARPATPVLLFLWLFAFLLHVLVIVGSIDKAWEIISLLPLVNFCFLILTMNRGVAFLLVTEFTFVYQTLHAFVFWYAMGMLSRWDVRMLGWTVLLTTVLGAHLSDAVSVQRVNIRTGLLCTTLQMVIILYLVSGDNLADVDGDKAFHTLFGIEVPDGMKQQNYYRLGFNALVTNCIFIGRTVYNFWATPLCFTGITAPLTRYPMTSDWPADTAWLYDPSDARVVSESADWEESRVPIARVV